MEIGISTACFYPGIETENTLDIIGRLKFSTIEAFLETNYEYEEEYIYRLKDKANGLNIKIHSLHAFPVTFEPYLFDKYPRRRNDAFSLFKKVIKAAEICGAKCYTFHGNRSFPGVKDYRFIADIMDELGDIAADMGVVLAWENVAWCESCSPDFIYRVMEKTSSGNIKFTLDFKQAIKSGLKPEDYIQVMGSRVYNVHLNDADDSHVCLLPGRGMVNFAEVFRKLRQNGYNGNFIIEVYRENFFEYEEITASKEYIESIVRMSG